MSDRRSNTAVMLLTVVVVILVAGCKSKRAAPDEPVAECMEYATAARPCFGERAAARLRSSFAVPPRDEAGRAALRSRCIEQRDRVRRVCH